MKAKLVEAGWDLVDIPVHSTEFRRLVYKDQPLTEEGKLLEAFSLFAELFPNLHLDDSLAEPKTQVRATSSKQARRAPGARTTNKAIESPSGTLTTVLRNSP